jgi:hypothetical protein
MVHVATARREVVLSLSLDVTMSLACRNDCAKLYTSPELCPSEV